MPISTTVNSNVSKASIRDSGIFGYELLEDLETSATLYELGRNPQIGVLCRTSNGIRFLVDGVIHIALDNESIDTVMSHSMSSIGASVVKRLCREALKFKARDSSKELTFAVSVATSRSWSKHFNTFVDATVQEQI